MDELTIKIVMILFPGIICTILLDKILEHKPWDNFKYSLLIIFYGIFSYTFLQLIYIVIDIFRVGYNNFDINNVTILSVWNFSGNNKNIPYIEVLCAGIVALLLVCMVSYIEHKGWLVSFLMKLNITEKYGTYTTHYQLLRDQRGQWIDVTIWDKNLFIRGIILSINETNGHCELLINQAEVFIMNTDNDSMESLYFTDYISISEKPDNLLISTTQQPSEVKND